MKKSYISKKTLKKNKNKETGKGKTFMQKYKAGKK